jgi:hypothetical protein
MHGNEPAAKRESLPNLCNINELDSRPILGQYVRLLTQGKTLLDMCTLSVGTLLAPVK